MNATPNGIGNAIAGRIGQAIANRIGNCMVIFSQLPYPLPPTPLSPSHILLVPLTSFARMHGQLVGAAGMHAATRSLDGVR